MPLERKIYSLTEFRKITGIGRSTLHRWIKDGRIDTIRLAGRTFIPAHILAQGSSDMEALA